MNILMAAKSPGIPEMFLRLVISCACGLSIGMERSKRFKEAGIRTHIIACCAAALFMLISKYGFGDLDGVLEGADRSRIAAGVVTGISFLCAGVIIQVGSSVHGLTTAVGLWLTAAVGLSIGAGMYGLGIFATVLTVAFQSLLHHITFGNDSFHYCNVKMTVDPGFDFGQLKALVLEKTGGIIEDKSGTHNRDNTVYEFVLRTREAVPADAWRQIMDQNPAILSISHNTAVKS